MDPKQNEEKLPEQPADQIEPVEPVGIELANTNGEELIDESGDDFEGDDDDDDADVANADL